MHHRTGLAILVGALLVAAPASANDQYLIAGFRTNDFARILPNGEQGPSGYTQTEISTDPSQHIATANYEAADGDSFANVRIFAWPPGSPVPVENDAVEIIKQSISGIEDMIVDEGFPEGQPFEAVSGAGRHISCLQTQQNEAIGFIYCVAPVKGRVMETQHFASIEARTDDERRQLAEDFVSELVDHIDLAE